MLVGFLLSDVDVSNSWYSEFEQKKSFGRSDGIRTLLPLGHDTLKMTRYRTGICFGGAEDRKQIVNVVTSRASKCDSGILGHFISHMDNFELLNFCLRHGKAN